MSSSSSFTIVCQPPFRAVRSTDRRVLLLPDGNHRKGEAARDYAAGADTVVACAEHLATRGDIGRLLVCVASRQNIEKRPNAFFQALTHQFERLRMRISEHGVLVRRDIQCVVRGDLAQLSARGEEHRALLSAIESACRATGQVVAPRMVVEFWVNYGEELAFEQDIDLLVRTGMERSHIARPGMRLPPSAPCVVTTTLWPDMTKEELDLLVDQGLEGQRPHFAPGHALDFIAALLTSLPHARIPIPFCLEMPVCASGDAILAMLEKVFEDPSAAPRVEVVFQASPTSSSVRYGADSDAWACLRLVPAVHWMKHSEDRADAVLTPGQDGRRALLAAAANAGAVHPCAYTVAGVVDAIRQAVCFPVEHVQLQGADRSIGASLAASEPFRAELLYWMRETSRSPSRTAEALVQERVDQGESAERAQEMLIECVAARALSEALQQGILLPDPALRVGDRNYAYTGAAMMLRLDQEATASGQAWEGNAALAIRCMLAISAGDNGVFDRCYPNEGAEDWRIRLDSAGQYLDSIAQGAPSPRLPQGRGMQLVRAIGEQWRALFEAYAHADGELLQACRDALSRHYRANLRERDLRLLDNRLVHRLGLGGAPRRNAIAAIELQYAAQAPGPVGQRIRHLLRKNVYDPREFEAQKQELRLLMRMVDTASSIAVEVLFLFCALSAPRQSVTAERLSALIAVGQMADYVFRLANDLASFGESGEERDPGKESCLTILMPRSAAASRRAFARHEACVLGEEVLGLLRGGLVHSLHALSRCWPAMACCVQRAVALGRGVYERGHYTTLGSEAMLTLVAEVLARYPNAARAGDVTALVLPPASLGYAIDPIPLLPQSA